MGEPLQLRGKRVLVTGARGFLGSHLCERLVAEGAQVHAVSRSPVKDGTNGARWWQCDLLDLEGLAQLLRKTAPDFVYHLSGHVSATPQIANVLPAFHSLLTSTVNLLTLLADVRCNRLVVTGSLTEPHEMEDVPDSPYSAAKWAGAAFARMFHALYGTPVVIVRPYMVYGPRQSPGKVVPYTISSLARGVAPRLTSGAWAADWIYVSDVVEGLILASTVAGVEGSTIDLGCGKATSIKDVVDRIVEIMSPAVRPAYGALPERPHAEFRTADVEHTRAILGWESKVSLDEGLAATVSWFTQQR